MPKMPVQSTGESSQRPGTVVGVAATDAVVVGPEADEEGTNDKSSVEVVVDVLEVEVEIEVEVDVLKLASET